MPLYFVDEVRNLYDRHQKDVRSTKEGRKSQLDTKSAKLEQKS